jgi:amidase
MGVMDDFESYDALGLAELVRQGQTTPEALLEAAIARVEARNPELNAVVMRMYDEARRSIQAGLPQGQLRGVPFLLKDLGLLYKGFATTFGSRLFTGLVAGHDSTLVSRYRQAGLVVFGKTNTPEFGITVTTEPALYGSCRNPWNLARTTGGSSGGAAAAVAAGMVPAAHASDGGGSIRIPAACCGLFGLKPTRARIPSGPDVGEGWNGMSTDHVITRSVRDSAAFLDLSAGPSLGDPYCGPPATGPFLAEVGRDPGSRRIAFTVASPSGNKVDPQCVAAVQDAARLCDDLGHAVEEAAPVFDFELFQAAAVTIINTDSAAKIAGAAKVLGREVTESDVEYVTWRAAEAGREISAPDYVDAVRVVHQTGRKVARFFETYDLLLSPVLLQPPVPLGYLDTHSRDVRAYVENLYSFYGFTSLFNATGQPAMSVPLYWTPDGLPVGLQFAGRFGDEALLLRMAGQLEQARPWKDRRPSFG